MLIGGVIGIAAGVIAAVRRGKASDYAATTVALLGLSVPHFWLGLLMIIVFAVEPQLAARRAATSPSARTRSGTSSTCSCPRSCSALGLSAVLMRQMRSAMLDSLGADYVRTARAKGLSEWSVVGKHALRNSLITVMTVIGLQLGALISGAVVTEQIFGIAGFGRLTIDSIAQRDYALLQGVVLVAALGYVVVNLLVDVAYSLINPRIRVAGTARELRRGRSAQPAGAAPPDPAPALPAPAGRGRLARRRRRGRLSRRSSRRWVAPYDPSADRLRRAPRRARRASTCSGPTTSAATRSRASSGARGPRSMAGFFATMLAMAIAVPIGLIARLLPRQGRHA